MDEKPQRRELYHFPGITVIVPEQKGDQIIAIDKGSLNPKNFHYNNQFTLVRHIANIALVKKDDYEQGKITIIRTFDPPIEFRVGYNFDDAMKAECGIDRLKLAYWSGTDWVIISNDKYNYLILPPSTGTVAEAKIWSWVGDPPIAWGK
jgi:hypothetical protein